MKRTILIAVLLLVGAGSFAQRIDRYKRCDFVTMLTNPISPVVDSSDRPSHARVMLYFYNYLITREDNMWRIRLREGNRKEAELHYNHYCYYVMQSNRWVNLVGQRDFGEEKGLIEAPELK